MGLLLTYTDKGTEFKDSYHRVTFSNMDKKIKNLTIHVKVYSSKGYADLKPLKPMDGQTIIVSEEDYTTFFEGGRLDRTLEEKTYIFLKTIGSHEGPTPSKYLECRFNYRDESTDVLEEVQKQNEI